MLPVSLSVWTIFKHFLITHTHESSHGTRCVWVIWQTRAGAAYDVRGRGTMHKKQNLIALFMWTTLIIANFNDLYAIHFYGGRPTTTLAWTTRRMRNNFTRLKRTNFCEFRFVFALHSRHAYRIANLKHNPTELSGSRSNPSKTFNLYAS